MRRPFPAFFITSFAMLVCVALVHAAATYNNTVSGAQTASPESEGAALNLNATGDLPGMLNIKLQHEGGNVTGGTWTMTVGIDHHQPLRKVVVSSNNPTGLPLNFESLDADGTHRPYSNVAEITGGLKIAAARDAGTGLSLGGFNPGELFSGTGVPGVIARVAADGATVQNPWVTLAGETSAVDGGVYVDRTGIFNGDLIAITSSGNVWRITSAGVATRVAELGTPLEGVTTVPNDVVKYGPWAGKILAGAKTQNAVIAIDALGSSTSYPLTISPQDIRIISPHENFYGVDPVGNKIWGAPDDAFAGIIDDVLIAQGTPGKLVRVRWNGTEFEVGQIAEVASWKQITFSPAALSEIAGVKDFYDKIAVVRHAPELNSGRVEGALWQLLPRATSPLQLYDDVAANEGLRRVGNGLWNLLPIPRSLNAFLGQNNALGQVATQMFATAYYSILVYGPAYTLAFFMED